MTQKTLGVPIDRTLLRELIGSVTVTRGSNFGERFTPPNIGPYGAEISEKNRPNPISKYFDSHTQGPGIWKWRHYFEIYERHFHKFIGRPVNVLEIGIYSGGSLGMWKHYFGPDCRVFGVDIEPDCKAYESDSVRVFVGDQGDRDFWRTFRKESPSMDIVIDDGGHLPEQQIVTLEETLPYLRAGGVYLCEDIGPTPSKFMRYISGLLLNIHNTLGLRSEPDSLEHDMVIPSTNFQAAIHSVHVYPFVVVIERNTTNVTEFVSSKRGTEWLPPKRE